MSTLAIFAGAFVMSVVAEHIAARSPEFGYWWYGLITVLCAAASVINVLAGDWGWAVVTAVAAVINGFTWWSYRRRRKRRRVAAMLGAKSRALRDALVRRAREAVPRPVLRPSPVPS